MSAKKTSRSFLVDTNFVLRYLLEDNAQQVVEVKKYLKLAQEKKIFLKLTSEVILEIEYVLRKVYQVPRKKIRETLVSLLKSTIFDTEKLPIFLKALDTYSDKKLDLVDLLLFYQAKEEQVSLLTFDKGLQRLSKVVGVWSEQT